MVPADLQKSGGHRAPGVHIHIGAVQVAVPARFSAIILQSVVRHRATLHSGQIIDDVFTIITASPRLPTSLPLIRQFFSAIHAHIARFNHFRNHPVRGNAGNPRLDHDIPRMQFHMSPLDTLGG